MLCIKNFPLYLVFPHSVMPCAYKRNWERELKPCFGSNCNGHLHPCSLKRLNKELGAYEYHCNQQDVLKNCSHLVQSVVDCFVLEALLYWVFYSNSCSTHILQGYVVLLKKGITLASLKVIFYISAYNWLFSVRIRR